MQIKGFRLFTVQDKDGGLLDVQCTFTAKFGLHLALYGFHFKLAGSKLDTVQNIIDESKKLSRMREKIVLLGEEPDDSKDQTLAAGPHTLVPDDEGPAKLLVLEAKEGNFIVKVRIKQKRADDIIVEVPFEGAPGRLGGHVFDGLLAHLGDGMKDVGTMELEILNIGQRP